MFYMVAYIDAVLYKRIGKMLNSAGEFSWLRLSSKNAGEKRNGVKNPKPPLFTATIRPVNLREPLEKVGRSENLLKTLRRS
jgi:hypothetical protein